MVLQGFLKSYWSLWSAQSNRLGVVEPQRLVLAGLAWCCDGESVGRMSLADWG